LSRALFVFCAFVFCAFVFVRLCLCVCVCAFVFVCLLRGSSGADRPDLVRAGHEPRDVLHRQRHEPSACADNSSKATARRRGSAPSNLKPGVPREPNARLRPRAAAYENAL
jgi:hypothetical protein